MVAYTLGAYHSTMKTLIEGAILAIIVVFIFLRDWRATLIAAIALPLSIIPAFWAIDVAGFSLNLVSLLAITIVTGILVDDAIVEIENIVRHMRMGKSPYRAALEAADEIGLAVIAITFTIIAVFVPVSFMGGIAGQYFKQFGLVVAFAVFFSLLVARLITPLLAAYFMRTIASQRQGGLAAAGLYPAGALVGGASLQGGGAGLADLRRLDRQLLPAALGLPAGRGQRPRAARRRAAAGLAHGRDARRHRRASRATSARAPEVQERVRQRRPRAWARAREVRKATLIINLVPKDKRKLSQDADQARRSAAASPACPTSASGSCRTTASASSSWSSRGATPPPSRMPRAELTSQAKRIPLLANVVSTAELDRPELRVVPITDIAAELGVSTEAISEAVRIATIGDIGANLAKFDVGDRQVPIRVQLEERRARRPADAGIAQGRDRRRARPCRCRRWRASSSARARPPSTATTACAAS